MNYTYDEEYDEYVCIANIDEDEYYRVMSNRRCPYFRFGDGFYPFSKLHSVRLFIVTVLHSDSRLFGTQILFEQA